MTHQSRIGRRCLEVLLLIPAPETRDPPCRNKQTLLLLRELSVRCEDEEKEDADDGFKQGLSSVGSTPRPWHHRRLLDGPRRGDTTGRVTFVMETPR